MSLNFKPSKLHIKLEVNQISDRNGIGKLVFIVRAEQKMLTLFNSEFDLIVLHVYVEIYLRVKTVKRSKI